MGGRLLPVRFGCMGKSHEQRMCIQLGNGVISYRGKSSDGEWETARNVDMRKGAADWVEIKIDSMYPIPDCRKCLQPLIRGGSKIMEVESIDTTAPTDKNAGLETARRVGCVNLCGRKEVGREIHKASHPRYRKDYP